MNHTAEQAGDTCHRRKNISQALVHHQQRGSCVLGYVEP